MQQRVDLIAPSDQRRYRRILFFFATLIAQLLVIDILLGRLPLLGRWVKQSRPVRLRRMARRFRGVAVAMGGVLIKLGQFLSARVDVLPPEITEELAGLQDEVPPVPFAEIEAVLRQELGDLTARFAEFASTPLAAASLGQVYRAKLRAESSHTDQSPISNSQFQAVVVKVQRPEIERVVRTDLDALRVVARWVMRYGPIRRRANVPALMEEFARTLWQELDYQAEASHAARFAAIFAEEGDVIVPRVYQEHSTARVLTLENVAGLRINDVAGMQAAGIDPTAVAVRLLDIYFKQVFQAGFFHADPHPGNIFVRPRPLPSGATGPTPFEIAFVDFGMMGNIQAVMGENLRQLLLSITRRDARALTQIYNNMGFFLPGADLERIAEAQEKMLGRLWGRSLQEMARPNPAEIRELSLEFKDLLRHFPFQIPQDFIYLGRAIGMLSGLTSQLHPDVNLWTQMEAYALKIVGDERVRGLAPELLWNELRAFLSLPLQVRRLVEMAEQGKLQVQLVEATDTTRRLERLERRVGRLDSTIITSTLLITGALLYTAGSTWLGLGAWGVAILFFLGFLGDR